MLAEEEPEEPVEPVEPELALLGELVLAAVASGSGVNGSRKTPAPVFAQEPFVVSETASLGLDGAWVMAMSADGRRDRGR